MTESKNNFANHSFLSVEVSLEGFSFVSFDKYKKDYAFFSQDFQKQTPEKLLVYLKRAFQTQPLLRKKYTKVALIHSNPWATLVPDDFFDKAYLPKYLEYSTQVFSEDFIAYDNVEPIKSKLVYIPFVNVNNYFLESFGAFDYYHIGTKLLQQIHQLATKNSALDFAQSPALYVHIFQKQMIVIYWKGGVKFYNSFVFKTPEDFLYYILFVLEQLHLSLELPIWLYGTITVSDKNYKLCKQYLKNIAIIPYKYKNLTHQYTYLMPSCESSAEH